MPRGSKKRGYVSDESSEDSSSDDSSEYDVSERSDDEEPPKKKRKQSKNKAKAKGKKKKKGNKKKSKTSGTLTKKQVSEILDENDSIVLGNNEDGKYVKISRKSSNKKMIVCTATEKSKSSKSKSKSKKSKSQTKIKEKETKFKTKLQLDRASINCAMEHVDDGFVVIDTSKKKNKKISEMFDSDSESESESESESSSDSSESESEDEESESKSDDRILQGKKICISGGMSLPQKKIKNLIESNGGILKSSVTSDCEIVLVGKDVYDLSSSKCQKALTMKNCQIITEDWLHDCIEQKTLLITSSYQVGDDEDNDESSSSSSEEEDEDVKPKKSKTKTKSKAKSKSKSKTKTKSKAKSKGKSKSKSASTDGKKKSKGKSKSSSKSGGGKSMKKFVMKGAVPVDEHFPRSGYHVWENNGTVWDAMLNQTNISSNNNKFYKLQILESDNSPKDYFVWFRWARVGYVGQNTLLACGTNTDKAISQFCKKFKDKTVNDWNDRNDFVPHAKKYTYIPMNYSSKKGMWCVFCL